MTLSTLVMLTETKKHFLKAGKLMNIGVADNAGYSAVPDRQGISRPAKLDKNMREPSDSAVQVLHSSTPTQPGSPDPPPRSFARADGGAAVLKPSDSSATNTTLATGLGHDIGNIVLPMLCYLDSLDSLDLPEDAKSHVRALRQSAMHLKRLSNGLNLFAHDTSDWYGAASQTNLHFWWNEVQNIVKKSLPRRVTLKADIPEDLPAVSCPAHQLTRAIVNLVSNAGESITDRGSVRVEARHGDNGAILLSVIDTGHGMTEEVRRRALDPFFTTKKRALSTGLGLTQVNDIATAARGSVNIESEPGQGTTVTLTLRQAESEAPFNRSGTQRSALIVMNDARISSYARTVLEDAGFIVRQGSVAATDDSLIILQGGEDALQRAVEFVRQAPSRRAIVLSREKQSAPNSRVVVIDQSHRALQRELQQAARDFSERPANNSEE